MNKKTKIQIKSIRGNVLFEYEKENNTIKDTLVRAVSEGAYLQEADLQEAYLREAYLQGAKELQLYWHIHHDILVENLTEPIKNRIDFIKKNKPNDEIKLRLKLLKKVECKSKNLPITKKGWDKLSKQLIHSQEILNLFLQSYLTHLQYYNLYHWHL